MQNFFINFFSKDLSLKDRIGHFTFFIGVFLLPSAMALSVLFFLVALSVSFLNPNNFLKDKWNYPFFISSFLMILSSLRHFENTGEIYKSYWEPSLSLIGLLNWIPLFFCFWGFQKYLNSQKKRIFTAKVLICGSIPIIFSGILQLLNINGPFKTFYGLIVWFQKPIHFSYTSNIGSLSGLFSNPNYAGLWMVMIWPFCIAALSQRGKSLKSKFILLLICLSFLGFILLTDSRNAILSLLISTPLLLKTSFLFWYIPIIIICFLSLAVAVVPIFPNELQTLMKSIIPSRIYTLFPEIGFSNLTSYPRINKWYSALGFIVDKPIFGWGATAFPIIYQLKTDGEWFGHAHNLPLEVAVSYGLVTSLLIFSTYIALLFLSFKQIFKSKKFASNQNMHIFQKAWWASSFIFFVSHLSDVQYFDGRISIVCWILLAGLRCSIKETKVAIT